MTTTQIWELYAIKYGTIEGRNRNENFLTSDPHDNSPMTLDYFVWAAISDNKTIIIDTGFNDTEAKKRGRILQRSVTEGLSMIGITASNVSDVIVTHLHYYNFGGHTEFPLAKFHLQ